MKRLIFVLVIIAIVYGLFSYSSKNGGIDFLRHTPLGKSEVPSTTYTPVTIPPIQKGDVPLLEQINMEYTHISKVVLPSVVNITSKSKPDRSEAGENPMELMPFLPPGMAPHLPPRGESVSTGSGVIVSKEGHIITNAHVIKGAKTVEVRLHDNRLLTAKVIAADELADIGVIQIEAQGLTPIVWGDSEQLQVGEQVLAIGNPFGLSESVSAGIVSAKGRNPNMSQHGSAVYEDYIQTDAAINPGNSGGALVNIRGELIGINAAILSAGGGFNGIGFAIPSNLARFSMESLIKTGKVVRGYLGVEIGAIDPDKAKFFDLPIDQGAMVNNVAPKSPAQKGGLQRGDIILEIDGIKIKDPNHLRLMVAQALPGKQIKLGVMRNRNEKTLTVTVGEQPKNFGMSLDAGDDKPEAEPQNNVIQSDNVFKGLRVQDLDPRIRQKLELSDDVNGVIISEVEEGSPAEAAKLQPGVIIQEIQPKREAQSWEVKDVKSFTNLIKKVKKGEDVLVFIRTGRNSSFVILKGKE
ncbi:MAG: Do family serine endopeptidase [Verrucomicrobiota bacterium]